LETGAGEEAEQAPFDISYVDEEGDEVGMHELFNCC
jgi:hypothetical protein